MVVRAGLIGITAALSFFAQADVSWEKSVPLPDPVQEIYPTVWQGSMVVGGGLYAHPATRIAITDKVWRGKPGETWEALPALPEKRHHPMLVGIADRLFSVGGFVETADGKWTNSADTYELTGQGWQTRAPLPHPLAETVSAVIDGKLHVAGGRTPEGDKNGQWRDSTDTQWHGVYDPKTDTWHTAAPLPEAKNSACGVQVNGKWHVIGGRTKALVNLTSHHVYSPAGDVWTEAPAMPQAQGGLACAALNNTIYVFGGEYFEGEGGVFSQVWAFDTEHQRWQAVSEMPVPRHGLGAVTIDDAIYVIGGAAKMGADDTRADVSVLRVD
ncbi:Kelch repeat-containing protein [Alteromonas sp. CYL-A6]|uniref:Kelch repeat-containing protein n=1 Tax=Alteromonas nitratireducens TaxID=3390813 RepID=UPI0034C4569C